MPAEGDIRTQVARESERRSRLAVPALAGGVLYLLGTIILLTSSNGAPRVGLLQGLTPALSGVADPRVSVRAQYVKYISQHAFGAVAGSVVTALALLALTLILLVLTDATRFRRPQTWSAARPLLMIGGPVLAFVTVAHEVVIALQAHSFAVGHDLSNRAVDHATTKAPAIVATASLGFVSWVALTAGMVAVMINAQRVGLLPRWVSFLGMFAALLIFFGGGQLAVIPAFWMVMIGILFADRWP
ncbi:MAG: hypothetical protein QOI03_1576, partial [Solirubrobacteraceae bacterium]|nr:hypothetical protein [Solirubrobacteraceae bacterium]